MHNFQGTIATWISTDWKLQQAFLDFDVVIGSHSGEALAQSLFNILVAFGIEDRLLAVTSDNASNMCKMVNELETLLDEKVCASIQKLKLFQKN